MFVRSPSASLPLLSLPVFLSFVEVKQELFYVAQVLILDVTSFGLTNSVWLAILD